MNEAHLAPGVRLEWLDQAAEDPRLIEEFFQAQGVPRAEIEQRLGEMSRQVGALPPPTEVPPPFRGPDKLTTLTRIKAYIQSVILQDVDYVTEDPQRVPFEVPVFLLTAPGPDKSSVTLLHERTDGAEHTWSVTVAGTGLGAKQTVKVTHKASFVARGGAAKLVFLPMTMEILRMGLYEDGKLKKEFVSTQLAPLSGEYDAQYGVRDARPDEVARFAGHPRHAKRYPLAGDTSGEVATYQEVLELAGEYSFSVGVKAFGSEVSNTVKWTTSRKIDLKCELPAGREYDLWEPKHIAGVLWRGV